MISNFKILSSGYDESEYNIPIHIDIHQFLDWLIDRSIISDDWKFKLDHIRQLIDSLMTESNNNEQYEDVLKEFDYMIYFDIIDLISKLESSNDLYRKKNLFGQYTNEIMKKLDHIRSSYEKGKVYLSESSIILKRNVKYEIPSTEKLISKYEKQILDIEKKKIEYQRNIDLLIKNYNNDCLKYGLKSNDDFQIDECQYFESLKNFNSEILDKMIHDIESLCKSETIQKSIDFYLGYRGNKDDLKELIELIEKDEEETPKNNANIPLQSTDDADIHRYTFEIVDQGFDSMENSVNISTENIQILSSSNTSLFHSDLDHSESRNHLYDYSFRHHLLNNLFLLFYFFKQRIMDIELSSKQKLTFINNTNTEQKESVDDLIRYKSHIDDIIQILTSNDLQERLLMKKSKSYIERIIKTIKSKTDQIDYFKNQIEKMKMKRHDIENKIDETKEKLDQLIKRTNFIRMRTEEKISSLYNGRKTFIK